MAKKRTKADKSQRNVERLATRDDARRESRINEREAESEILGKKTAIGTERKPAA
ncbi:MAG: hypothetical protein ACHP78_00395 [Terriglobales bacterium]